MSVSTQNKSGPILRKHGYRHAALIIGLSIIYTGLVLGSGADRLTATHSEMATRIPALFASEALRVAGAQALADGDVRATLVIGKRALHDAPADPQSAAMLGAGLLASGDQAPADQAFRVAGRLGWRVPITQSYWLSKALSASDYDLAALRLDALLRQQPQILSQRQVMDPMERNPAGRAALIKRMALHPEWLPVYTADVQSAPPDVVMQRSDVFMEAAHQDLVLGCDAIAPIIARLIALNLREQAGQLAKAHCRAQQPAPNSIAP